MTLCAKTHEFSAGDTATCIFPANHDGGCAWESGKVLPFGEEGVHAAPAKKSFFGKVTPAPAEVVESVDEAPKTKGKK